MLKLIKKLWSSYGNKRIINKRKNRTNGYNRNGHQLNNRQNKKHDTKLKNLWSNLIQKKLFNISRHVKINKRAKKS